VALAASQDVLSPVSLTDNCRKQAIALVDLGESSALSLWWRTYHSKNTTQIYTGLTAIKNGQSRDSNASDSKDLTPQNKRATADLVRLPSEDQKIIHAVGFHEILRFAQFVAGLGGFANDHSSIHPMICSVAIAINDSDPGSWSKR
jgi:hypothetical protein